MNMENIPFGISNWSQIPSTEHAGETGTASWHTQQFDNIRVRMVEYSPGYLADHWCTKGHILYVLEGEITTELKTGEQITLTEGMSYQVSDNMSAHRSYSERGARLFIVDGEFLKINPSPVRRGIWM